MIDLQFVRGLIEAVDQSGIDSLEISRAGTRIRIAKSPPAAAPAPSGGNSNSAPHSYGGAGEMPSSSALIATGGHAAPPPAPAPAPPVAAAGNLVEIRSPMVGTFYRAPSPEAPSYVEVGAMVSKGQTLCILEAMKLMNELESEVSGVVREILVENAEPVEYGQILFRIEPTP
jgi:acetyl-CoA carboxylase biotin carboxyl carrier protein